MSFTKNDRKLRSDLGKTFPIAGSPAFDSLTFQAAIADALRRDFGGSTAAVKRWPSWSGPTNAVFAIGSRPRTGLAASTWSRSCSIRPPWCRPCW